MSDQIVCIIAIVIGGLTFVGAQYEWYWDTFMSGHWKQWNTPGGRLYSKIISLGCVVVGVAGLLGLFPK